MFLAIREIRHSPTRFVLISAIIFLVSYLVFFLTGLAFGLASSYTGVIDTWGARSVIVSETANQNMLTSRVTASDIEGLSDSHDATEVFVRACVYEIPEDLREEGDTPANETEAAFLFGVHLDSSAMPDLRDGSLPQSDTDLVVPASFQTKGYAIGDTLRLVDSDTTWTITGFSEGQTYQAAPAFFISYDAYATTFDYALKTRDDQVIAQALLINDDLNSDEHTILEDHQLEALTMDELKAGLPGYQAQILTFTFMIASLIGITAFVLGIFIYVLTLQKRSIFGIMKAQGVPTSYILFSGAVQTMVLTFFGVFFGVGLAVASGYFLGGVLPFRIDLTLYSAVAGSFFIFTLFGALAPIRTISKIDPLEAIG